MTVVAEGTDLSWVRYLDADPGVPCEREIGDARCRAEAVYRLFFRRQCPHPQMTVDLCLPHKDEVFSLFAKGYTAACRTCRRPVRFLRAQVIR